MFKSEKQSIANIKQLQRAYKREDKTARSASENLQNVPHMSGKPWKTNHRKTEHAKATTGAWNVVVVKYVSVLYLQNVVLGWITY